ncbi:MAG: peroxidase family protein [Hyphomicrobiaceae bacterium]
MSRFNLNNWRSDDPYSVFLTDWVGQWRAEMEQKVDEIKHSRDHSGPNHDPHLSWDWGYWTPANPGWNNQPWDAPPPWCSGFYCHDGPICPEPDLTTLSIRNMDGTDNNAYNSDWGAAGAQFIRLTPAHYSDGVDEPEAPRANYRELSNDIIKQDGSISNSAGVSDLFTFFGQFIDHDIDIALEGTEEGPYVVAPEDDIMVFQGKTLGIERSIPYEGSGTGSSNPREHANAITSFIDASNVYGSDDGVLESLRDTDNPWLLKMTANGDLLPLGNGPHGQFLAGDIRAGENSALTSVHTIWAKEHNRIADALHEKHPDWSDDEVFNAAKITVEALMQHIVYDEWLPLLVGQGSMPEYMGYNPYVDPTISHEFASAAFRFGHSLLSSNIQRLDEDGESAGDLQLAQMFFNAAILKDAGSVDTLVRGLAAQSAQELDHHLVEDVRSLLFPGPDGIQVRDLSVLNNLRGLDHGLGTLNEVRDALGLDKYSDFYDLTGDQALADALAEHYNNSIDEVDLWIGGLLEQAVDGGQLGETFQYIVLDQFTRLRDGDSYFYEERLQDYPELLAEIKDTSFSDIIKRNTDIKYLQDDAFIAHQRIAGDDGKDHLDGTDSHDLIIGFGGKDKIKGKDGDDDIYAGSGNDKVWGGRGDDVIYGEEGNDHLHGGRGRDLFVFEQGSGRDKVKDFNIHKDTLDISDYGFSSLWDVYEAAHITHKGVVIALDGHANDSVTLVGVKLHQLSDTNFVFDNDDPLIA